MRYKKSEIKRVIETYARGFAADFFEQSNPQASKEAAWAYSARHWQEFVSMAIDVIAMHEAIAEAEGAPNN